MPTMYQRSHQALSAPVDSDHVALQTTRGMAFGMEGVTASVWELVERPTSLDQIVATLRVLYEVDEMQCRAEVDALLREMVAEGLIVKEEEA